MVPFLEISLIFLILKYLQVKRKLSQIYYQIINHSDYLYLGEIQFIQGFSLFVSFLPFLLYSKDKDIQIYLHFHQFYQNFQIFSNLKVQKLRHFQNDLLVYFFILHKLITTSLYVYCNYQFQILPPMTLLHFLRYIYCSAVFNLLNRYHLF